MPPVIVAGIVRVSLERTLQSAAHWAKEILEFEFHDETLLSQALTHRSAARVNNERLEFLGDAVLDFVISDVVYQERPTTDEGDLSRLRASLVRDSTLAELAATLGLSDHLILGSGEKKSGGFHRTSIMANALEAIFGAIYLDAGFDAARQAILRVYAERLAALPELEALKDPKTRLQEHLQARGHGLPQYVTDRVSGKAHRQRFEVSCRIDAFDLRSEGTGTSRRDAEQDAAAKMLELLDEPDNG